VRRVTGYRSVVIHAAEFDLCSELVARWRACGRDFAQWSSGAPIIASTP
jgi:hypothetical protein